MERVDDEDQFREAYLRALGLWGDDKEVVERRREAWLLSHDIRKLEIELYWSRSQYFWALQVGFFAALGFLIASFDATEFFSAASNLLFSKMTIFAVAVAGLSSAYGWRFVTLGAKRWQDNWERHVDMLEPEFSGNLYKTYLGIHEDMCTPPFSVSKVNGAIASLMIILWCALLASASYALYFEAVGSPFWLLILVLLTACAYFGLPSMNLKMDGYGPELARLPDPERPERSYVIHQRVLPPGSRR